MPQRIVSDGLRVLDLVTGPTQTKPYPWAGVLLYTLYLGVGTMLAPYPSLADVAFYTTLAVLGHPAYVAGLKCVLARAVISDRVYGSSLARTIRIRARPFVQGVDAHTPLDPRPCQRR